MRAGYTLCTYVRTYKYYYARSFLTSCKCEAIPSRYGQKLKMSLRPTVLALLYLAMGCALVSLAVAGDDEACPAPTGPGAQSTCVCQTDAGQIIDLRPLANFNGTARYIYVKI